MDKNAIHIRLMKEDDFDAVVKIDEKVLKSARPEYYKMKFEKLFSSADYVPTSLVAEENGKVIGFVMGEIFIGEFGISKEIGTLDTIGVDPDYQKQGLGELLINEFVAHLKSLGVEKLQTLVDWNDTRLVHFFTASRFAPSRTINLERVL